MQEVEMDEVRRLREAYDNVCDERDEYLRQLEEQKLLVASLQEENQTLKSQLQASTSTSSCSQETAAPQQRCAEMERAVVLWQGACFVAQREAADAVRRSEAVECSTTQGRCTHEEEAAQLQGALEALRERHATLQLRCVQLESSAAAECQAGQLAQEEAAPMPAVESRIVRIGLSNSAAVFRQQLCLEEGSRHLTTLECRTLAVGMRLVHGAAAYCHALALGGMSRQETTFVQLRGLVTAELRRPASSGNGGASSGGGGASSSISGAPILWVARSSHGGGAGTLCLEMGGYASLLAAADRDERVRCGDHLIGLLLEVVGAAGGKDKALALATDLKNSVQNPQPGKVSAALKSALAKLGIATAQRLSAATAPPSTAFATLMLT